MPSSGRTAASVVAAEFIRLMARSTAAFSAASLALRTVSACRASLVLRATWSAKSSIGPPLVRFCYIATGDMHPSARPTTAGCHGTRQVGVTNSTAMLVREPQDHALTRKRVRHRRRQGDLTTRRHTDGSP